MSEYDYEDAQDPEDELDEHLTEEPPKPPEDMKLTVQVGLSEYSPQGLLELIARGLLVQIGGRDKWVRRLTDLVEGMMKEKARALVEETMAAVFSESVKVDFEAVARKAAEEYMSEKVNGEGRRYDGYNASGQPTRTEWLTSRLVKEAMDSSFKQAESEWKAKTVEAIKGTLTQVMAERLAKALPAPVELR